MKHIEDLNGLVQELTPLTGYLSTAAAVLPPQDPWRTEMETIKGSWRANAAAVVVEGTVQPDGTLEVTQKVDLPAGRVHVTVQPVAEPVQPDRFWKMMESIWAAQLASGRTTRTREEIDAEIAALRNESEEEMQAVERKGAGHARNRDGSAQ